MSKDDLKGSDEQCLLLDSKHITTTLEEKTVILGHENSNEYDIKVVDCGEYLQVYRYNNKKVRKIKEEEKDDLSLRKITYDENIKHFEEDSTPKKETQIEERSIIRSKLECQRLAKANMRDWKTFITLTFADEITDIKYANKRFNYFIGKIRRVDKNFKYIAVPEFMKSGRVHYHLLTNVDINDNALIYAQEDRPEFKHIKYWNDGFDNVEVIQGNPKKIVGYISKYMTKEVDNRLFGHRRYFYSNNLDRPKESYIDLDNEKHRDFYIEKIQDKVLIYQNEYINTFDGTKVTFLELSKDIANNEQNCSNDSIS